MSGLAAGGIIAAGLGERLRSAGVPKPMVRIGGRPLVGRVLDNFVSARVERVGVIFNESELPCAAWVEREFGHLSLTVILRTTASSLESFRRVLETLPRGRILVSTVDALCSTEDFRRFAETAAGCPENEFVLGVTPFVEDEKPLWIGMEADGRITSIGGPSGPAVTAGLYAVPPVVRDIPVPDLPRLRDYLAWLIARGICFRAVSIDRVVDVDRPQDVSRAEEFIRTEGGPRP